MRFHTLLVAVLTHLMVITQSHGSSHQKWWLVTPSEKCIGLKLPAFGMVRHISHELSSTALTTSQPRSLLPPPASCCFIHHVPIYYHLNNNWFYFLTQKGQIRLNLLSPFHYARPSWPSPQLQALHLCPPLQWRSLDTWENIFKTQTTPCRGYCKRARASLYQSDWFSICWHTRWRPP